jgi:hypothetical protein
MSWDVTGLPRPGLQAGQNLEVQGHRWTRELWITSPVLWWFRGSSSICAQLTAVLVSLGLLAVQADDE